MRQMFIFNIRKVGLIMNITKKSIERAAAFIFAVAALFIMLAVNTFSTKASAAPAIENAVNIVEKNENNNAPEIISPVLPEHGGRVVPLAAAGGAAGGATGGSSTTGADITYKTVINFFITWFRRIGAVVALIGAIMFGLAIKNNDADQKQNGLVTMIAGIVVAAICQAADMFDLFT